MPKRKTGCGFNRNKHVATPKNLTFKAIGSLDNYVSLQTLPTKHDLGQMNNPCFNCGSFMWKEENHIGTLGHSAVFSTCCSEGKILLPTISDPPLILQNLLTNENDEGKEFCHNIRAYNSSLAFASLGVNEDVLPSKGPYTFRIHGSVYHRIGHVFPEVGEQPKFSQIYIYNTENETNNRIRWNSDLNRNILELLQNMLHHNNPFAKCFKHTTELFLNQNRTVNMKLILKADTSKDPRRYNLPTVSELSVIIPGSSEYQPTNRDIVLYKRASYHPNGQKLLHINETNQHYDPLHYVLLFPYGDSGWTIGIQHKNSNKQTSIMNFYAYHMMQRNNFNTILRAGRLFHQYVVDQYAKLEQQRLNYCLFHQNELRSELYQGLADAVQAGDTDGKHTGKKIILPSSFIGSPRHMQQMYQDAMAIVRRFGKPDLFITFTCNPKWPDIERNLLSGQTSTDRLDLVARVFHLKLKELLKDITVKNVFGKVIAFVYTIEFQKRGLPHAHILLILHPTCKPKSSDDYDMYVTAEIPSQTTTPELYKIITQHMIHGPCGPPNPKSPCMEDGKCSKQYPKEFCEKTVQLADGYPKYRRPENGLSVQKNGVLLDNRWIVPYNPYLCSKYSAHINVEIICSSVTAVKYLYKYVYEGHDRVMASIQCDENNEIQRYVDARYVSASEACWRIFHYDLHDRSPAVQRLAVHLPGQHNVVYKEGKAEEALQNFKDTTLTSWFKANIEIQEARNIPYHLFPEHFTWNASTCTWKKRKLGNTIGRLYLANPAEGERFFLRLILHHSPGCKSFQDLLTLEDGTVCNTFKETAMKRGFLQNDEEWIECMSEAAASGSPSQLRLLFATI